LQIEGGTTEIDKDIFEKLVDPLTHLVRNSIDHGIETVDGRLAAGKSETGTVI
jgi:two-component system chemotaxis sensor kinase CheA